MRVLFATLVTALGLAACSDPDPVGARCDLGAETKVNQTLVASPSIDCQSRMCLHVGSDEPRSAGTTIGMCTADCETDDDCVADPTTPCPAAFVCEVVTDVGAFAGRKVCACPAAAE